MPATSWIEGPLGQFIELKRGYDLPTRMRAEGPYPVISSAGMTGTHVEPKVRGPGVVMGRYGTIGQVFFVEEDYWPLNTTLYVRDFKGSDPRFVSYFLRSMDFTPYTDKAAVPGVNRNHIHRAVVRFAPIAEQRAIARTLGALDERIQLNRRMGRTLEAVVRAVFKSWFVAFDPVRARMEARPPILPTELVDHFPDRLVESPIGPVPEGWGVAPLGEHVEVVRGLSYRGADLADEGMPLHNLNSVLEGGGYKYDGIKYYAGEYKERHLVEPGDVIVANTEQGHQYLLIGYPAIVPAIHGREGLFSADLFRVRPAAESSVTRGFLYFLLSNSRLRQKVTAYSSGTTVNHLSIEGLRRPRFVVPPRELIEAFDRLVGPMFELAEGLVAESRTFAETRDWLLPRLVSGRVRVRAGGAANYSES